jgi:para-aminobenzoate synthetase/4-amino-4-deoxychorismate lyase
VSHLPIARGRLVLDPDGALSATAVPFAESVHGDPRVVVLAHAPISRENVLLYHKTTARSLYDAAIECATGAGAEKPFDVLLWNEAREATELTRGNLVAEIDGMRWTPPIECGLLAGTLRAELLKGGELCERVVTVDEAMRADRLWFVNSLRGWVPIVLVGR